MSIEVVCALIGFGGSVAGSIIGIFANAKLTNYRLEQLEKKVDKHNNLAERMTVAEKRIDDIDYDIKRISEKVV